MLEQTESIGAGSGAQPMDIPLCYFLDSISQDHAELPHFLHGNSALEIGHQIFKTNRGRERHFTEENGALFDVVVEIHADAMDFGGGNLHRRLQWF